jgi:hypothetical protein
MRFIAVAMLCCLALVGCAVVNSSGLTGLWIVKDESRRGFLSAAQQKGAAKIALDANGAFAATEIPEDLLYGLQRPLMELLRATEPGNVCRVTAGNKCNLTLRRLRWTSAVISLTALNSIFQTTGRRSPYSTFGAAMPIRVEKSSLKEVTNEVGYWGFAGSGRWYTMRPPAMVIFTLVVSRSRAGIWFRSTGYTTKSANIPGAILPLCFSSNSA